VAHEPIDRTNEVIDLEREYTRLQRANPSDQKTGSYTLLMMRALTSLRAAASGETIGW